MLSPLLFLCCILQTVLEISFLSKIPLYVHLFAERIPLKQATRTPILKHWHEYQLELVFENCTLSLIAIKVPNSNPGKNLIIVRFYLPLIIPFSVENKISGI